ncbi:hypothetical protein [Herbidospora daliensis]|uniref:hypothetical protein n=1 Tax=Herbidospora daliensis TaxID=295585 RepID=UPI000B123B1B|nr:hypothetical protein [Herbidospora daliensis]
MTQLVILAAPALALTSLAAPRAAWARALILGAHLATAAGVIAADLIRTTR